MKAALLKDAQEEVFTKRVSCRACDSKRLEQILDLGVQFLPRFVKEVDYGLPRAPLELVRCAGCGLLQLGHTVNPDLLFRKFWYRSSTNETMRKALDSIVDDGLRHSTHGVWIDIGANDGYLLSRVPKQFHRVAFEPARNFASELEAHADMVVPDYFKSNVEIAKTATVITSAAMFYDVDNPGRFIDQVRDCLVEGGVWINQLNDAPTMIRQMAFDSICHEHLCYYDVPSLRTLYEKHGMTITNVSTNAINGGSIRVTAMRTADQPRTSGTVGLLDVSRETSLAFAAKVKRWKEIFGKLVIALAQRGPLWAYGASTKGTVLTQYMDQHHAISFVADKNPEKHGRRMAGSWLPIKSEEEFRQAKPQAAVVLPWAFKREFLEREKKTIESGTAFIFPLPRIEIEV